MSERIDVRARIAIGGTAGSSVRDDLAALTRQLAAGQAGQLRAGAVMRCVLACAQKLLRARVRSGLGWAAGAMARARLGQRLQAQMATGIVRATANSGPGAVR